MTGDTRLERVGRETRTLPGQLPDVVYPRLLASPGGVGSHAESAEERFESAYAHLAGASGLDLRVVLGS